MKACEAAYAMKGANARAIQQLAGRADRDTTMRYMHLA